MPDIHLVFFSGCPNAKLFRNILNELGVRFTAIDQNQLPDEHPYKAFSSPSIIRDGKLAFGAIVPGVTAGSCSIVLESEDELRESLKCLLRP